jgi:YYY domain-containing protein
MIERVRRANPYHLGMLLIVAVGLFLRAYGLNWDEGLYLHPDERFIAIVSSSRVDMPPAGDLSSIFDPETSPLNPRRNDPATGQPMSFAYGTLPVYVQSVTAWAVNLVTDTDYQSYPHIYKVGRVLNVLLDTLTIVLVFLLAQRLFRPSAGLVAAALYALAVLPIQLSHFFTVDIWLTFFVTAALYVAIRYLDRPSYGRALALAVPVGCAFATKASVPSLIVPLLVMAAWALWRAEDRLMVVSSLLSAGALAIVVFSIFEPYAIINSGPFIEDIRVQSRIVRGQFDVPFTRQFVGLTPGLYELRNAFLYTLGPGFLLAGLAGVVYGLRRCWKNFDPALLIALIWIVAYLPTLLLIEARFLRYTLPLVPVLAALAGGMLTTRVRVERRALLQLATTAILIVTAVWAIGFTSIYGRENSRIAASKWMTANIPAGSAVASETWDDVLPLPYAGASLMGYQYVEFMIYDDAPPEEKAQYIAETLMRSDYVVLSSDRVIDSVDNLPWRYAVQNEYYRRLLAGQLGYQLVYQSDLRPELFGIRYDDSAADESFTVYDHPRVRIFKKVESLDAGQIRERLLWGINQPWEPQRYPSEKQLMLDEPVSEIETTGDAGWNGFAVDHALIALIVWLAAVELIGLAVLPLAAGVLGRTPDRGMFSARLLGLILLGWVGWIAATLDFWQSRSLNITLALAAIAAACWGYWRWRDRRGTPIALPGKRAYLASLGAWLGLFGFFLLLRAIYPDFWQTWFGGEKPFELAYLRAVSASTSFPPYDPWYADGIINYYYYGWHLIGTIIKLSGVGVSYGFQFGSATFAALLGLQTASLGATLFRRGRPRIPVKAVSAASAVAVVAVVFIGNLDAFRQVIEQRGVQGDTFDFWRSRSVIDFTINEFPYFSEIWADLHPHVLNFPSVVLLLTMLAQIVLGGLSTTWRGLLPVAAVTSLVLGTVAVTNSWDAPLMVLITAAAFVYIGLLRSPQAALTTGLLGALVVAGAFVMYAPFYLGFYSVVQGLNRASSGSNLGQFLTHWGIFFGVVVVVCAHGLARRLPSDLVLRDGLLLAVIALVGGTFAELLAVATGDGLPSPQQVIAILLAAATVGLAAGATRCMRQPALFVGVVTALTFLSGTIALYRPAAAVALAITTAATMHLVCYRRQPSRFLPWAFVAIGAVTAASTEFVYVADDLQHSDWERMNTVFKFYLQSWILLAIGCAVLVGWLWREARFSGPSLSTPAGIIAGTARRTRVANAIRDLSTRSARVAAIATSVLLALGMIYPVVGTPVRLDWDMESSPSGLSLDGYAWMNGGQILNGTNEPIQFSGDLAAIDWLNTHVNGTPVILEAAIGPYRGNGSRISSATGLPTVLGWDRHQRQQRYEPGITKRMADVHNIYNETNPALKLEDLRRYRVRYVIVGDVERYWNVPENPTHYASTEGLASFEQLVGNGLEIAFESGTTRIYAVTDFPSIAPAPGAVVKL